MELTIANIYRFFFYLFFFHSTACFVYARKAASHSVFLQRCYVHLWACYFSILIGELQVGVCKWTLPVAMFP